MKQAKYLSN
jgi:hypothetical protein